MFNTYTTNLTFLQRTNEISFLAFLIFLHIVLLQNGTFMERKNNEFAKEIQ